VANRILVAGQISVKKTENIGIDFKKRYRSVSSRDAPKPQNAVPAGTGICWNHGRRGGEGGHVSPLPDFNRFQKTISVGF